MVQKVQINEGMHAWMAKFLRKGRNVALSPGFASAVLKLFAWKKKINRIVINTSSATGDLSGLGKSSWL